MATIYEDVETLKTQMTQAQTDIEALQSALSQASVSDSGWLNLPLTDGIEAYATTQIPQYRKIGDIMFLRGAVKGITAAVTIGTLPTGYRPNKTVSFLQNTSVRTGGFVMTARYTINSSGEIRLEFISDGAVYDATKWFPIHVSFAIN